MESTFASPARTAGRATISLRKATSDDAPQLLELHRAALTVLARSHYSAQQIDSLLRYVPTLDDALIDDRTYFVAEADGRIVACGGWSLRAPGYQPVLGQERQAPGSGARPALIRAMYTHPDWSRRGLGRRILDAAEKEARKQVDEIELDALLPGLPLYAAAGYLPVRNHAMRFPDGEAVPVIYMRKRLSSDGASR
jgi:GNAT superfamily N-acetyltransferase